MHPIGLERGIGDGGRRQEAAAASADGALTIDDTETPVRDTAVSGTESHDWTIWDRPLPPSGCGWAVVVGETVDTDGYTRIGHAQRIHPSAVFFPREEGARDEGVGDLDE